MLSFDIAPFPYKHDYFQNFLRTLLNNQPLLMSLTFLVSYTLVFFHLRPFQFNYLSYKLFLEKKSCQTPKKVKKSHLWCLTDESGFEIFCQTPKKKKKVQVLRIFFVRVIQSSTGSYHCCSRASDLRRYTSHPSVTGIN